MLTVPMSIGFFFFLGGGWGFTEGQEATDQGGNRAAASADRTERSPPRRTGAAGAAARVFGRRPSPAAPRLAGTPIFFHKSLSIQYFLLVCKTRVDDGGRRCCYTVANWRWKWSCLVLGSATRVLFIFITMSYQWKIVKTGDSCNFVQPLNGLLGLKRICSML